MLYFWIHYVEIEVFMFSFGNLADPGSSNAAMQWDKSNCSFSEFGVWQYGIRALGYPTFYAKAMFLDWRLCWYA